MGGGPETKAPQPGCAGERHRHMRSKIRSISRLCRGRLYSVPLDVTTHCRSHLTLRKRMLGAMPARDASESIGACWAGGILCALRLAAYAGIERAPPPELRPLAAASGAFVLPAPPQEPDAGDSAAGPALR
jgi:hypothetical protein